MSGYGDQACFTLSNGLKMPLVGYGTFLSTDENELRVALRAALDAGYRHIDAALVYRNEHIVGEVLQEYFKSGKLRRENIFVTTKLWGNYMGSKELIRQGIDTSLKSLQLDYVDLYLVHLPMGRIFTKVGENVPVDEDGVAIMINPDLVEVVWRGMEDLVDAGLAKSIGVSNFNSEQITRIMKLAKHPIVNNQVEVHVYLQQKELVDFCKENDITVTAYAPLGAPGFWARPKGESTSPLEDPLVLSIAEKHKRTPGQILLKFLLSRNICVIPKSVKPTRVAENFDLFGFELEQTDMEQLRSLNKNFRVFLQDFQKGLTDHAEYPFNIPF